MFKLTKLLDRNHPLCSIKRYLLSRDVLALPVVFNALICLFSSSTVPSNVFILQQVYYNNTWYLTGAFFS